MWQQDSSISPSIAPLASEDNDDIYAAAVLLTTIEAIDCSLSNVNNLDDSGLESYLDLLDERAVTDEEVAVALEIIGKRWNPYFVLWSRWAERAEWIAPSRFKSCPYPRAPRSPIILIGGSFQLRQRAIELFSWAIPDPETLKLMINTCPRIVEVGSGSGYWAAMLSKLGADVVAVDRRRANSDDEEGVGKWFENENCLASQFMIDNDGCSDCALFLCCPGKTDADIAKCLPLFEGRWIFSVGEGRDGYTLDIEACLNSMPSIGWNHVLRREIPSWLWTYHYFDVYERR